MSVSSNAVNLSLSLSLPLSLSLSVSISSRLVSCVLSDNIFYVGLRPDFPINFVSPPESHCPDKIILRQTATGLPANLKLFLY